MDCYIDKKPNNRIKTGFAEKHSQTAYSKCYMTKINFVAFLLLVTSFCARAEVSDKMASISDLWIQGFFIGLPVCLLIAWKKGFLFLGVFLAFFMFYAGYATLNSDIGAHVIHEQGTPYIIASYSAFVVILLFCFIGYRLNGRRVKNVI